MLTLVHRACGLVEVLGGGGGSSGWYIRARCADGAERLLSADPVFWSDPAGTVRNALWAALVADAQGEFNKGKKQYELPEPERPAAHMAESIFEGDAADACPENGQELKEVEAD